MTAFPLNAIDGAVPNPRAAAIDAVIASSRAANPIPPSLMQRRTRERLTVREINQLNDDAIKRGMSPVSLSDKRTPTERFLDIIDLPRNAMANIAFGELDAPTIAGGIGETAAWGAAIGALGGSALGPAGTAAGAAGGALIAGGGTALAYGLAALARPVLSTEASRRAMVAKARRGTFGAPQLYASDVLEQMGVENRVARAVIGFGGDVLMDPTTWLSGGGSVVAKVGTNGTKATLNKGGARLLRDYGKIVAATGELPVDPVLARFNHLFETSVQIGDDVFDVTGDSGRLAAQRDMVKSYIAQRAKAAPDEIAELDKELRVAQRTLRTMLEREVIDLATGDPTLGKVEAYRQRIARDFMRDYAARSSHQIAVPFSSFIMSRVPGYQTGNIPIGGFGEQGRFSKFLKGSEDEFLAATRETRDAEIAALRRQRDEIAGERALTIPQRLLPTMAPDVQAASSIDESGNIRVPLKAVRAEQVEPMLSAGWALEDPAIRFGDFKRIERQLDQVDQPRRLARKADLSAKLEAVVKRQQDAEASLDEAKLRHAVSAALTPDSEVSKWQAEIVAAQRERDTLEHELGLVAQAKPLAIEGALDDMHASFREGDVATALAGPFAAVRRGAEALFGNAGPKKYRELEVQAAAIRQQKAMASRVLRIQKDRLAERLRAIERFQGEDPIARVNEERAAVEAAMGNIERSLSDLRDVERNLPASAAPPPVYVAPPKSPPGASKAERAARKQLAEDARAAYAEARREWKAANGVEVAIPVQIEDLPPWLAKDDRLATTPNGGKVRVVRHETTVPASPHIDPIPGRTSVKGQRTSFDIEFQSDIDRALYEAARPIRKGNADQVARSVAARRWASRVLGISEGKATARGRKLIESIEKDVFGFSPTALPAVKKLALDPSRRVYVHGDRLVSASELRKLGVSVKDVKPIPQLLEPSDWTTLSPVRIKEATEGSDGGFRLLSQGTAAGHAIAGRHFVAPPSEWAAAREKIAGEGLLFTFKGQQSGSLLPWDMTAASRRNLAWLQGLGRIARGHADDVAGVEKAAAKIVDEIHEVESARIAAESAADDLLHPINSQIEALKDRTPFKLMSWMTATMNQTRTNLNLNANRRFHAMSRKYRAATEEQFRAVKQQQLAWIEKATKGVVKETGAEPQAIRDAITVRVVEKAMADDARSAVGFLPDDPLVFDTMKRLRADTPQLLSHPQVEAVADRIHESWNDFAQIETHLGILHDDAPDMAYLPIAFTERMRASYMDSIARLAEPMKKGSATKLTTNPSFSLRRATNRMLYGPEHEDLIVALALRDKSKPLPPDLAEKIAKANVGSHNSVFTGELWKIDPGDANGHPFEAWRIGFLRRMFDRGVDLTTAGDRHVLGMPGGDPNVPGWLPQQFPSSPALLNYRRDLFRDKGADLISGNIFEEDILTSFSNRAGQHHQARATAKFVEEVVPYLKPIPNEDVAGLPRGFQPGTVVMDGVEYRPINPRIVKEEKLGIFSPIPREMLDERYYWPVAFANDVEDMARKLSSEAHVTGILRGAQMMQSWWKGLNLAFSPSWWTGNMISGALMSHLIGGSRVEHWPKKGFLAMGLVNDIHGGTTKMDATRYVLNGEEWSGRELKEALLVGGVASAGRTQIEVGNILRTGAEPSGRFASMLRNNPLSRVYGWWFSTNAKTDDVWRVVTALDLLDQGHSIEHAVDRARLAHVDFGDLSFVEGKYGTLIWPFYRWMAGNMKLQLRHALERPAYAAMFPKLKQALDEGFEAEDQLPVELQPKWMRDNIAVQIGSNPNLRYAMLKTLSPAQELFEAMGATMGFDGLWEFMSYATGTTNPLLRMPAEIATQRELFTGRDIGTEDPGAIPWAQYWTNQMGLYRRGETLLNRTKKGVDDPVGEIARQLLGGSRLTLSTPQQLVARFGAESRESTESLRARIKSAKRNGDVDEAERLSVELTDLNRRLYQLGYVDMVPKSMRNRFRAEDARRRAIEAAEQAAEN